MVFWCVFSTLLFARAALAGDTFQCEEVQLIIGGQIQTEVGQLCTVSHTTGGFFGLSPLESLSLAAKGAADAALNHCAGSGQDQAQLVANFLGNSFLVETIRVENTTAGSDALITGKFLCTPEIVVGPVEWRKPVTE